MRGALYYPNTADGNEMASQKTSKMNDYGRFLLALGERIKQYRVQRGWTQHYIIKNSDFYDSHWRKIEHGKTMSMQSLYKIAKMFGVHVSELLDGIEGAESIENKGNQPIKEPPQEPRPAPSKRTSVTTPKKR